MPVRLRLQRRGRKGRPFYSIVAADSRAPRDGRSLQKIGFYDPIAEPAKVYMDHDAALKWLKVGAQPTNTVRSLLRHTGVTVKFALFRQGKSEEEAEQIFNRWRTEKDAKTKKKMISVDIAGTPLEPVPASGERKGYTPPAPPKPVVEEVVEEPVEAPAEETVVEETPVVEAAATEETAAVEEATPAAEEAPAAESPAAEEAPAEPAEEEKKEE